MPRSCTVLPVAGAMTKLNGVRFGARALKCVSPRGPQGSYLIAVLSKIGLITLPAIAIFVVYIIPLMCVPW